MVQKFLEREVQVFEKKDSEVDMSESGSNDSQRRLVLLLNIFKSNFTPF